MKRAPLFSRSSPALLPKQNKRERDGQVNQPSRYLFRCRVTKLTREWKSIETERQECKGGQRTWLVRGQQLMTRSGRGATSKRNGAVTSSNAVLSVVNVKKNMA